MKVYFTASLIEREKYEEYYWAIIKVLESKNYEVIKDVMFSDNFFVKTQSEKRVEEFSRKWFENVKTADVAVVEASFPSTINVGFELASLLNEGKPVIALCREGSDPMFISNVFSNKIIKYSYTKTSLSQVLEWALEEAKEMLERRFTFIIDAETEAKLETKARAKKLTKSEYIRELINNGDVSH